MTEVDSTTYPWTGQGIIRSSGRTLRLVGKRPPSHGWHTFTLTGRKETSWTGSSDLDPESFFSKKLLSDGFLVEGFFVREDARGVFRPDVAPDPIYLVEMGLDLFSKVRAGTWEDGRLIFVSSGFPHPAADEVRDVYHRQGDLKGISGVPSGLTLAFKLACHLREEEKRKVEEEEKRAKVAAERAAIDAIRARRTTAMVDFRKVVVVALAESESVLVSIRDSYVPEEAVVRFVCDGDTYECVVKRNNLQVVDSGICLTDHDTGRKDDALLTLESLPSVIREAKREGLLVVYRH